MKIQGHTLCGTASNRAAGIVLRSQRVIAGLSLCEAARIVGLSDVEYGEVERGLRTLDADQRERLGERIRFASCGEKGPWL